MGIELSRNPMPERLAIEMDGLILKNPIMPASGPLVGDASKCLYLMEEGVGALVTKTISIEGAKVPRPCIYGTNKYVMNAELWSEYEHEVWLEDFLPRLRKEKTCPMIVSVGYTAKDMEVLIPLLNPFADAFEVSTHYVGKDLGIIKEIVKTIRDHTSRPIYMKVSPHIPDKIAFCQAVLEAGATGVVAINSLGPVLKINPKTRSIEWGNDQGYGWMSGPVIMPLALAVVRELRQAFPTTTIIGVGGITSAMDVVTFLMAGATGVQLLSGALIQGKDLYSKIIKDLPKTLDELGIDRIVDIKDLPLRLETSYQPRVPKVNYQKCTTCMLCEKVCPYFAIYYTDKIEMDETKCFGCHLCLSRCPVGAIHTD